MMIPWQYRRVDSVTDNGCLRWSAYLLR